MAVQSAEQMGYASPATIRSVIDRFRDQGLPQPLTAESILRIGVTESLAPRTLQTLKLLGLIDDQGNATEQFERLRRVATSEFKGELVSMLRSAYAPVFEVVEPAGAPYEHVQDAFRTFKPEGQRDRMVSLFLGLLEYAEYGPDLPKARAAQTSNRSVVSPRTVGSRIQSGKPSDRQNNVKRTPPPPPPSHLGRAEKGHRDEVDLGEAGTVVIYTDVRWTELPIETLTSLHKAIQDIKALGSKDFPPLTSVGGNEASEEDLE